MKIIISRTICFLITVICGLFVAHAANAASMNEIQEHFPEGYYWVGGNPFSAQDNPSSVSNTFEWITMIDENQESTFSAEDGQGFAMLIMLFLHGEAPAEREEMNDIDCKDTVNYEWFDDITNAVPGDYIRFGNHSSVVIQTDDKYVYVVGCDWIAYAEGESFNYINWGRPILKASINKLLSGWHYKNGDSPPVSISTENIVFSTERVYGLSNCTSIKHCLGRYNYIGSLNNAIARVDIPNDDMAVILYEEPNYQGRYIALKGKGTYYLELYKDDYWTFYNQCSSLIIFDIDVPPCEGIIYGAVIAVENYTMNSNTTDESNETTIEILANSQTAESLNFFGLLLNMTVFDAMTFLGDEYSYVLIGVEGTLGGYCFPSYGITLAYTGDPRTSKVTYIYCSEDTSIGAVTVGMSMNEITQTIGSPVRIVSGDEDDYHYNVYIYRYMDLEIAFIQSIGVDCPAPYAVVYEWNGTNDVVKEINEQSIEIDSISIQYSEDCYEIDIIYPVVIDLISEDLMLEVNEKIKNKVDFAVSVVTDYALEDNPDTPYRIRIRYSITRNDGHLLSIYLKSYIECGGARASNDVYCITVLNTEDGEILTLGDLFSREADYSSLLCQKARMQFDATPEISLDYSLNSIDGDQSFYLTDSDLVLVFQENSIASSVVGILYSNIPIADMVYYGIFNENICPH